MATQVIYILVARVVVVVVVVLLVMVLTILTLVLVEGVGALQGALLGLVTVELAA